SLPMGRQRVEQSRAKSHLRVVRFSQQGDSWPSFFSVLWTSVYKFTPPQTPGRSEKNELRQWTKYCLTAWSRGNQLSVLGRALLNICLGRGALEERVRGKLSWRRFLRGTNRMSG